MMKLLAAQCGQNLFLKSHLNFLAAHVCTTKKNTSRMVEEQNLVKLLQGEKNRNKNEMRLHIKEFWPHCAILVDILFYMYFTTLSSCLLSLI